MSFFGSLFGTDAADAANKAAQDQYSKQQAATAGLRGAGDTFATNVAPLASNYDPYRSAGTSSLTQLLTGLGLTGRPETFTAAYRNLPGYQAGLDRGLLGVQRGINAQGLNGSGRALKALYRYGSDYEDQRANDYLNRLTNLQGQGLQATGAATAIPLAGEQGRLSAATAAGQGDFQSAGTIGQGMVAGEQAKQSALQNLLGTAAYLGGSFLGGPLGGAAAKKVTGLFGSG